MPCLFMRESDFKLKKGAKAMSEEKRNLIRDVTTKINDLPDLQKQYVAGLINGLLLAATTNKPEEEKCMQK